MNAERRSLAEAFKPAATQASAGRGTSLEGLLPPKRKQVVPAEADRSAVDEPRSPEALKDAEELVRESRPKVSESATGPIRNVGVYLPPVLLERVKETVRAQQSTYADLLGKAFDVIDESALARAFEPDVSGSGTGMPRRIRRPRGEAGIQINVRLDDQQTRWVDAKTRRVKAPSRSALITAVYKMYLEQEAG